MERLGPMVTRPTMYARDGAAFDAMARTLLADLCFLDEREQDLAAVEAALRGYGKLGVAGPFAAVFGTRRNCVAEVASIFAEQFHRLGYLQVQRQMDHAEWQHVIGRLRHRFDGRDVRRSEVETEFGQPSLLIDKRVLCYAPSDPSGWIFIDCFTEYQQRYEPGTGSYRRQRDEDPLVRAVRQPAPDFESGLILTLYGKLLRWGAGWWLDHPEGLTATQAAIAAQLRDVEAADPSQAPRSRHTDPWQ
jgi:hypothetical protein